MHFVVFDWVYIVGGAAVGAAVEFLLTRRKRDEHGRFTK